MSSTRTFVLVLSLAMLAPALAVAMPLAEPLAPAAPQVTIQRDAYGVPHIYADDVYALFWGNGYAQAQDRLFQMDVLRHVGRGESARFLGPSQLEMDLATRRELYTEEEREARFDALPEEHKRMFQAFADGVNAWIAETRADPNLLSAEFYAIGHAPEDWIPEDTIAIAEYLLDIFGAGSGGNELDNARLYVHMRDALGPEEAEKAFQDLFPMHDPTTFPSISPQDYVYEPTEAPLAFADIPALQWEIVEAAAGATPFAGGKSLAQAAGEAGFPTKLGSNALVVSHHYAESGNTLLLGGPQMSYYNPMVPYEVALHGAGFDAVGMGVGGAPGVIIGRSAHYAWTVTSGSSDQVDVVALKLVDGNPRQYHVSGASGAVKDMECRTEIHHGPPTAIDPNPPVLAVQEVCRTERGPVFAMNEEAGYAFVRERTHRLDELRSGILWLTFAQADNLAEIQDHMETFCFEFNFFVATDGAGRIPSGIPGEVPNPAAPGDIAYLHFGCNPDRADGYDPRFPRLAGEWDWVDVRSGRELPHVINPPTGYIVNWNNKPAQGWSGGDAIEKWGPVHRVELFDRVFHDTLREDWKLNVSDLMDINVEISTRSPFPAEFVPRLVDFAWAVGLDEDPLMGPVLDELLAWRDAGYDWRADDATCDVRPDPDPCFGTHPPGFTIYEAWRGHMQESVFRDEMGPHMRELGFVPEDSSDPHAADHGREDNKDNVLRHAFSGDARRAWCDADNVPVHAGNCHMVALDALRAAAEDLRAAYGNDTADWRQPMHTIKFTALSGGPAWRIPMVNRPSFNHLYDWGTGYAGSVLPPGTDQSWAPVDFLRFQADGTLPDAHKRDQLDLYVDFAYKPAQLAPGAWESVETHDARPPLGLA